MKFRNWLSKKKHIKESGFDKLPRGWDRDSVEKFANSIVDEEGLEAEDEGWFDACVNKIEGNVENPQAFCAALRDELLGRTDWRGE